MYIKKALISAAIALTSSFALAGQSNDVPVEIDLEGFSALGNMKTARFSDNDNEFIGCGTRTFAFGDGTSFNFGFCQAGIEEGASINCGTEDLSLISQINAISDYSFITFRWDDLGNCTYVGSSTQSFYIPGKKDK